MKPRDPQKEELRHLLLAKHPEWKGRLYIYSDGCVRLKGVCTTWVWGLNGIEEIAKGFAKEFEWHINRMFDPEELQWKRDNARSPLVREIDRYLAKKYKESRGKINHDRNLRP